MATLTPQLDGLHRCQSDLGKWSRASALFASSKSVWIARLTARRSGTETEVTWKPQALEMPQAARSIVLNLFTTDLPGEAAAPDLRHQFTLQRSQTSAEAVEH